MVTTRDHINGCVAGQWQCEASGDLHLNTIVSCGTVEVLNPTTIWSAGPLSCDNQIHSFECVRRRRARRKSRSRSWEFETTNMRAVAFDACIVCSVAFRAIDRFVEVSLHVACVRHGRTQWPNVVCDPDVWPDTVAAFKWTLLFGWGRRS